MANSVKPWLDQAGKFPIARIDDIPRFKTRVLLDAPRTGVLHTTEGSWASGLAVFKRHYAPHFMLGLDDGARQVRIVQLVPVGTIGAALAAHNNKAIVQVEMVGKSKKEPWLPDAETVEALASLMAVCLREYAIPLERPWPDGDFGRYGNNPHRTSNKYGAVPGWFGHGDCPNPDDHWDPGNLQWSIVFARAREITDTPGAPATPSGGPTVTAAGQGGRA